MIFCQADKNYLNYLLHWLDLDEMIQLSWQLSIGMATILLFSGAFRTLTSIYDGAFLGK